MSISENWIRRSGDPVGYQAPALLTAHVRGVNTINGQSRDLERQRTERSDAFRISWPLFAQGNS